MAYKGKTISVALAAYNGEEYIQEQLLSIINQSVSPDQIVIADGGSTDNTIHICQQVFREHSNIEHTILSSNHQVQVNENFQRAIEKCKGDYILLSDQDDIWLSEKIERVLECMLDNNVVMAFTNAQIVNKKLNDVNTTSLWESIGYKAKSNLWIYQKNDKEFLEVLLKHNVVTGMCTCFSANITQNILPFCNEGMYDKWIAFVALHVGEVVAINEKLVLYRQHGDNQVGTKTNLKRMIFHQKDYSRRVKQKIKLMNMLLERLQENISGDNKALIYSYCDYLRMRCSYFEGEVSVFFLLKNIRLYKVYEHFGTRIILKDIMCKLIDKTCKNEYTNV